MSQPRVISRTDRDGGWIETLELLERPVEGGALPRPPAGTLMLRDVLVLVLEYWATCLIALWVCSRILP